MRGERPEAGWPGHLFGASNSKTKENNWNEAAYGLLWEAFMMVGNSEIQGPSNKPVWLLVLSATKARPPTPFKEQLTAWTTRLLQR